ncbi:MAG: lysophospholipid acyltransferase family protein [Anaerolineae bacterium]|jgi:1-acyl-sn-glycerol-3-phosphate acyltransferase|nr:1-acyl-sn-glycerol-3-phosphate acyltransferase [Chloroflexota bacterium]
MGRRAERIPYSSHPCVYHTLRRIIWVLMHTFYRFRVEGRDQLPLAGPTIFAMNHLHLFDPVAAGAALPRQVVVLAAAKWSKNWLVRQFLRGAGTIFVRRGEVDRTALRACLQVLNAGGALALAPEGTRSRTGGLQRAKAGVAYLASRTDAIIVPVACWGIERIGDLRRLKRPECHLVFGEPFRWTFEGKPDADRLQDYADEVMRRIAALLPEKYRGVYADSVDDGRVASPAAVHGEGQGLKQCSH